MSSSIIPYSVTAMGLVALIPRTRRFACWKDIMSKKC